MTVSLSLMRRWHLLKRLSRIGSYILRYNSRHVKMSNRTNTPIIQCSDELSSSKAVELLDQGLVVAIPTDTIYGLACSANCPEAIKRLYTIKGRDSAKPVAICVTKITDVRRWGNAQHLNNELLERLLPGPVTIVLEKTAMLDNPYLNPSTTKIGIRIPKHKFINRVTELFDLPVALTSANLSNEPSTLSIKEFKHLFEHLSAVFDGGLLNQGLNKSRTGSTVIDLSVPGYYDIIRSGISYENVIKIVKSYGLKSVV